MQALTLLFLGSVMLAPGVASGTDHPASLFGPTIHEARPTDVDAQQVLLLGIRDHLRQADPRLRALADLAREEEKLESLLSHLARRRAIPDEYLDSALRQFDRREQATLDALEREYQKAVFLAFPRDTSTQELHLAAYRELRERWSQAGGTPLDRPRITTWLLEAVEAVQQRPARDLPPIPALGRCPMDDLDGPLGPLPICRQAVPMPRATPADPVATSPHTLRSEATTPSVVEGREACLRCPPENHVSTPSQCLPVPTHPTRQAPAAFPHPRPTTNEPCPSDAGAHRGPFALPPMARVALDHRPLSRPPTPLPPTFRGRVPSHPTGGGTADRIPAVIASLDCASREPNAPARLLPTTKRLDARVSRVLPSVPVTPLPLFTRADRAEHDGLLASIAPFHGAILSVRAPRQVLRQVSRYSPCVDESARPYPECWPGRTMESPLDCLPTEAVLPRQTLGPPERGCRIAAEQVCPMRQTSNTAELLLPSPRTPEPSWPVLAHISPGLRQEQRPTPCAGVSKPYGSRSTDHTASQLLSGTSSAAVMPEITARPAHATLVVLASRGTFEASRRELEIDRRPAIEGAAAAPSPFRWGVALPQLAFVTPRLEREPRSSCAIEILAVSTERASVHRTGAMPRLPGTAFADPADLHVVDPADRIDLGQLRSRIAGYNLAIAELEADLNAPIPWTIDRLATLISRLQLLSARQGDLAMLHDLLPPDRRTGIESVESIDAVVKRLAAGVAAAREAARSGISSPGQSDPDADLMLLRELAQALTAIAER